jgi:kynurenine formamidase
MKMTTEYATAASGSADGDEWRQLATRIRNWGRWGTNDELGTLNLITAEAIVRAATCVRKGKTFALGVPINAEGPQGARGIRRNPVHLMAVDGGDRDSATHLDGWGGSSEAGLVSLQRVGPARYADDWIIMPCQAGTQWDALSHVFYDGQMYNGFPSSAVTSLGATKNSIEAVALSGGVVGRGILLDVARHRGVNRLEPHTAILPSELDEVAANQGLAIQQGDIVLIRTGWWQEFDESHDGARWFAGTPGLHWQCAGWLYDHEASAIVADNVCVESQPPANGVRLCFHMLALREMGMMLGEIWNLEALGADCADDGVYEFLLVAAALPITGAVGTPTNPIAIK